MKNKINDFIKSFSSWEFNLPLEDVINLLQKTIKENHNYFDFTFEVETESGYYGSCSANIIIRASRWETEEEFEKRIKDNNKRKAAARQAAITKKRNDKIKERELYESLKKKFEKEINEDL